MRMSTTPAARTRRTALALAAALAFAAQAPVTARDMSEPGSAVLAFSDEALPGEGRPPIPGPTDPDGPAF
jgi:hypothetical protein